MDDSRTPWPWRWHHRRDGRSECGVQFADFGLRGHRTVTTT
ncbi:MAG TPA: hypothetical protein VG167_05345 [Verrucomicrobiae bacterium]|nr:hypothetical protein [Verrucomicrobiae bacterium]